MARIDVGVGDSLVASRPSSAKLGRRWGWLTSVAWFGFPLLLGVAAWQLLARVLDSPATPPIENIVRAWFELFSRGEIVTSVASSLSSALIAIALAAIIGVLLGVGMARSEVLEAALRPYADTLMAAPLAVFVPVFIAVFNGTQQVIVATAFIYCLFPVLENARLGALAASPDLIRMARSFGCSRRRLVTRVLVPSALPLILTGLRIAVSKAFKGVLLGETLIIAVGLGGRIRYYGAGFNTDYVFALTVTTVVLALVLVALTRILELWLRRRFPSGANTELVEG
jgi:NitT/TauT family transport system permease protein